MIDVLSESPKTFRRSKRYMLKRMLQAGPAPWRIVTPGAEQAGTSLICVHVDLTEVPAAWIPKERDGLRILNGGALSIDRRGYSRARLDRDAAFDGPVIVKTVLNHSGESDMRYRLRQTPLGRVKRFGYQTIARRKWTALCPKYQTFPHLDAVPDRVWSDERLIVEKFLPGVLKPPIVKHRWDFIGEHSLITRGVFDDVLCDAKSFLEVEQLHDVPNRLQALRKRMQLDFGSIDYFETDDGAIPIDVNKTTTADREWIETFSYVAQFIADGAAWLDEMARR